MKLNKLKNEINKTFNVDITNPSRKRNIAYAKKVYCYISRQLEYNLQEIGDTINLSHDNVYYHTQTIERIYDKEKLMCNNIIKKYGLPVRLLGVKEEKKKELLVNSQNKLVIDVLGGELLDWDKEILQEFIETRLNPFKQLLKFRKVNKPKEEEAPLKLNKNVKNTFLC